jgi:hypothetical protein
MGSPTDFGQVRDAYYAVPPQHQFDPFDVRLLYQNEGLMDDRIRAFLVHAAISSRPPLAYVFDAEFFSMTAHADVISGVENARVRSVHDIGTRLSRNAAQFLNLRALTALWNSRVSGSPTARVVPASISGARSRCPWPSIASGRTGMSGRKRLPHSRALTSHNTINPVRTASSCTLLSAYLVFRSGAFVGKRRIACLG